MRTHRILTTVAAALLVGCASPSVVRSDKALIRETAVRVVYVPRFEGSPAFVDAATDYFIAELEPRIGARVIQGAPLRVEGPEVLAGGNIADPAAAREAARFAGADVVVMGKLSSSEGGGLLNGYSTVRVLRVSDGTVLASFHRPSGALVANSTHQAMMRAVKRTAEDVATALR